MHMEYVADKDGSDLRLVAGVVRRWQAVFVKSRKRSEKLESSSEVSGWEFKCIVYK